MTVQRLFFGVFPASGRRLARKRWPWPKSLRQMRIHDEVRRESVNRNFSFAKAKHAQAWTLWTGYNLVSGVWELLSGLRWCTRTGRYM